MKNNIVTWCKRAMRNGLNNTINRKRKGVYYGSFILVMVIIVTSVIATFSLNNRVMNLVNIGGRQRMLSAKIILYAQMMILEKGIKERAVLKDDLEETVDLMAATHQFLTQKMAAELSPKGMPQAIQEMYFSEDNGVDAIVMNYISHARKVIHNWRDADMENPDFIYLFDHGATSVMAKLDMLVGQYQKEGEDAIALIIALQRAALVAGLCLISLQLLFIFRPLLTRVKTQHNDLKKYILTAHEFERLTVQLKTALNEHSLVSATDAKGNIVFANEKFCDVSGYSLSELMGKNHNMFQSDVHDLSFYKDLWKTITSGEIWHGEICNISKSGKPYWVQSTIVPFLHDKTGKPIQYVAVRTEITQQKEMQEKLDELFMKTMAASDAKTNFIGNMSHELRTPLNHIIGFSQLLEMDTKDTDMLENIIYIKSAGYELLDKINNVLTLVSNQTSSDRALEVIDIVDFINVEFIDFFDQLARQENKKFVRIIPDHEILVNVDRVDLLTAFRGIAKNAVAYSSEGDTVGVSISEDSEDSEEGDVVTVTIFDTGPGIPEGILSADLEPFTIGEALLTKSNSGMGLGLPLAKKLCLKNKGIFEIENNKDVGVKIYFRFPIFEPIENDTKILKRA